MNTNIRNITLISLAVIAVAACKKSDDNNTTASTPSVTLRGSTYNQYIAIDATGANFFGHPSYLLQANARTTDGSKYVLTDVASLSNIRPTTGTYSIGGNIAAYSPNQLQLIVGDSSASGVGLYSSDSVTNVNATVTVTAGKVSVTVPAVRLSGNFTPSGSGSNTYSDTITFAGTMTVQ